MNGSLALGTVQFGMTYGIANKSGTVPPDEVSAILDKARLLGIDTLDTAVGYGESESVLGRLGAQRFHVISKLPGLPVDMANVEQWVQEQLEGSLARLDMAQLDGLLLHRSNDLLGPHGKALYAALCRLRADGRVRKIGVSVYGPGDLDALFVDYDFDIVQAPLNILDTRLVDTAWAGKLAARGVELHTRSTFLQGLLLMDACQRPGRFDRFSDVWKCWDDWLQESGLSALQACLRYVLSQPGVTKVVVGVDSLAHLQDIVAAAAGMLQSKPTWPAIDPMLINPSLWGSL